MLRIRHGPMRAVRRTSAALAQLHTSAPLALPQPNAPLDIDPAFQALLRDVDISLLNKKTRHHHVHPQPEEIPKLRELQEYPPEDQEEGLVSSLVEDDSDGLPRRSPAAVFGAQTFGMVLLPRELQDCISALIDGTSQPFNLAA